MVTVAICKENVPSYVLKALEPYRVNVKNYCPYDGMPHKISNKYIVRVYEFEGDVPDCPKNRIYYAYNFSEYFSENEQITRDSIISAIEGILEERRYHRKRVGNLRRIYKKRGYFFSKDRRTKNYLLDRDFIIFNDGDRFRVHGWKTDSLVVPAL